MNDSLNTQAIDKGHDEGGYAQAKTGMHTAPKMDSNANAHLIGPNAYMTPIFRGKGISELMTEPRNTCLMLT